MHLEEIGEQSSAISQPHTRDKNLTGFRNENQTTESFVFILKPYRFFLHPFHLTWGGGKITSDILRFYSIQDPNSKIYPSFFWVQHFRGTSENALDVTGSRKFKVATVRPDVLISQAVGKVATKFQPYSYTRVF
jgi:hypothetical protein